MSAHPTHLTLAAATTEVVAVCAAESSLLVATHAVVCALTLQDGKAPGEIKILPAGEYTGRDGRGPYRMDDPAAVVTESERYHDPKAIVVDYDHQSDYAAVPGVGGRAPAAGWIRQLVARDDGIYAAVTWTDGGRRAIEADEYRYLSPVFEHDKSGRIHRILRVGLTNNPNLDLPALTAATQGATMPSPADPAALTAQVCAALNLPADTADTAVLTEIRTVAAASAEAQRALDDIRAALGLAGTATPAELVTAAQAAVGKSGELAEKVAALDGMLAQIAGERVDERATATVEAAIDKGQVLPGQRDWALSYAKSDPSGMAAYLASQPVQVVRGAVLPDGTPAATAGERDGESIGQAAQTYIAEQRAKGITVTASAAVDHVMAAKGIRS